MRDECAENTAPLSDAAGRARNIPGSTLPVRFSPNFPSIVNFKELITGKE
ncbi:MAG: hypothetical protein OEV91_03290 [Desulfobulbaceae bacterium]|nr:hypothetical protein [Desulfobulbaceae bacterium]